MFMTLGGSDLHAFVGMKGHWMTETQTERLSQIRQAMRSGLD